MNFDVVVVTYESAGHVRRCLEPLPTDTRVFVVDNASSDASAEVATELGAEVIRNATNRGFAAAANQGASRGTADTVLFLNPDATITAVDLERLHAGLETDPSVAIVGPRLVRSDGSEQRGWWPLPSAAETWREALGLRRLRPVQLGPEGEAPFVVGACLLVRRRAFEQLGGFDEAFWLYGEEADLCRRAWDAGWRVRYVDAATAHHVGGASGEGDPALTFEHFQRGAERFIAKHQGPRALVLHRLGVLVGALLRIPLLAVHPRGGERRRLRRRTAARSLRWLLSRPTGLAGSSRVEPRRVR